VKKLRVTHKMTPELPKGGEWPLEIPDVKFSDFVKVELPDWTRADAYPDPATISLSAWGWEFLRRNPMYQSAWAGNPVRRDFGETFGLLETPDPARSPYEPKAKKYSGGLIPDFRTRPEKYLNYLRAWDARVASENLSGIVATLYPDRDKDDVQKDLYEARRLVFFGYRELLAR
jgi:hypothetical protein